jgi:hypothetical protein
MPSRVGRELPTGADWLLRARPRQSHSYNSWAQLLAKVNDEDREETVLEARIASLFAANGVDVTFVDSL